MVDANDSATPPGVLPPRVRIAPSPTGDPHVGTAYIGLFNFVFARRWEGAFVLRIEDTDQTRSSRSSEESILGALRWLGIEWDEGPDVGGPHGPYRQSERLPMYREAVDRLLDDGKAYRCFCSKERLDEVRKIQMAERKPSGYDRHCRDLSVEESTARAAAGEGHTVRMMVPLAGTTQWIDELRGTQSFENRLIDDQVILKSDGFPTYHLANVVDDHHMRITHVIRGEEWISSTPKHVLLYEAFGWDLPRFYHLGLLRNSDKNKSKLSKRKNPVSIFHYRDLGYMPATFLNFLGNLGYSFGDDRERFSLREMIDTFDARRLSVGGPVFDPVKLEAFNGDDIRAMDAGALQEMLMKHCLSPERLGPIVAQAQERITRLDDFLPYVSFFYGGAVDYTQVEAKLRLKKRNKKEVIKIVEAFVQEIESDPEARGFEKAALESYARAFCERHGWKTKEIFTLLRLGCTGRTAAPPLFDTLAICGKDRVRMRLRGLVAFLKTMDDWGGESPAQGA